jgi:hypothetical protein
LTTYSEVLSRHFTCGTEENEEILSPVRTIGLARFKPDTSGIKGRDSVVGIATGYRLDNQGVGV